MLEPVEIIVPTFNNEQYLIPMLHSILLQRTSYPVKLIVVNNGHPGIIPAIPKNKEVEIVQAPENLGWEGGLRLGLEKSTSKFVMFANDDIYLPHSSGNWLRAMMSFFQNPEIAAVGPTSNCVMGSQAIWNILPYQSYYVKFLIGFCMLLRRDALDKAGGITQDLPGGDDIDLSIRLEDAGYKLVVDRTVFVFHHGFKTGERVRGGPDQDGGWNSRKMIEETNHALIRKHGLIRWHKTFSMAAFCPGGCNADIEVELLKTGVQPGSILELGCGGRKLHPGSVGVDYYGRGEHIPLLGVESVADVKCSVESLDDGFGKNHACFDNIVAQHIIEHIIDPLKVLRHWRGYLNDGGKLLLAFPDERIVESIPLNAEHKHAFTPDSMANLLLTCGYENVSVHETGNGVSVVVEAFNPAAKSSTAMPVIGEASCT